MKKTISINISGIVFYIEEDAYEKLHAYLESIKKYFASYEGNVEIVADIENRIAEKFFTKLKADNKQALGMDDINELIASMGTVADFEAIEEEEDLKTTGNRGTEAQSTSIPNSQFSNPNSQKRLYRDAKRKVLGGVCAGLAHHFGIDVVWIRLGFLLLFFLPAPISEIFAGISAITFLGYIAYWVAFPANNSLEYDAKIKKFYRDIDNKALGGVAAGLAAYFGLDRGLVRFLFVISIFAGVGVLAYILFWIAAPKAESLTQKMEMKGEPVTLSNIEENVKQSLSVSPNDPENVATKLVLLPFRFVAAVVEFLGKIFKNLGPIVRILTGVFLMFISGTGMIALLGALGVLLGIAEGNWASVDEGFLRFLSQDISDQFIFFATITVLLPLVSIFLVGLWLLSPKWKISVTTLIVGSVLWFAAASFTGKYATELAMKFNSRGEFYQEKSFPIDAKKVLLLDVADNSTGNWHERPYIELEGYEDKDIKTELTFKAQGKNRQEAEENAKQIIYNISQKDSVLVFDQELKVADKAAFRDQDLEIKLLIPYDKVFSITRDFRDEFCHQDFDKLGYEGIWDSKEGVKSYRFVMKRGEGLTCLNCPQHEPAFDEIGDKSNLDEVFTTQFADFDSGTFTEKQGLSKFSELTITGNVLVKIEKGTQLKVEQDDTNSQLEMKVVNGVLQIVGGDVGVQDKVRITMPEIKILKASGQTFASLKGFEESKNLKVELSGEAALKTDGKFDDMLLDISGQSRAYLWGNAKELKANVVGKGELSAYHLEVEDAKIETAGSGEAYVAIYNDFRANATGGSKVQYRNMGNKTNNNFNLSGNVVQDGGKRKYD